MLPLGEPGRVGDQLRAQLPALDLTDPTWGMLSEDAFSIEFSIGKDAPVQSVMLHVRGGPEALGAIQLACKALDCVALDCSSGELIDWESKEAEASFAEWRTYRDRVVSAEDDQCD